MVIIKKKRLSISTYEETTAPFRTSGTARLLEQIICIIVAKSYIKPGTLLEIIENREIVQGVPGNFPRLLFMFYYHGLESLRNNVKA